MPSINQTDEYRKYLRAKRVRVIDAHQMESVVVELSPDARLEIEMLAAMIEGKMKKLNKMAAFGRGSALELIGALLRGKYL